MVDEDRRSFLKRVLAASSTVAIAKIFQDLEASSCSDINGLYGGETVAPQNTGKDLEQDYLSVPEPSEDAYEGECEIKEEFVYEELGKINKSIANETRRYDGR